MIEFLDEICGSLSVFDSFNELFLFLILLICDKVLEVPVDIGDDTGQCEGEEES